MHAHRWRVCWWSLLVVWALAALLGVNHIDAGLVTSYGADLTLPAWLYIAARSLDNPRRHSWLKRMIGGTAERTAITLFLASALTEASQYYWPAGVFPGVFDALDILAYGAGILTCYLLDRRSGRTTAETSG